MKSKRSLQEKLEDLDAWGRFIANSNLPNHDLPKGLTLYAMLGATSAAARDRG